MKLLAVVVLSRLAASPETGVARLIFWVHMVATSIQELGLTDELLKHLELEQMKVALAMLSGEPVDSPIHGGVVLT
jgi:hypothetical protein